MSTELTPAMRRSALIAALRDEGLWPEGFAWNFANCATCGIGLLVKIMDHRQADNTDREWENVARKLGLTDRQALDIFGRNYDVLDNEVTPAMVAQRLENWHKQL